jgi:hypothetical protein
LGLAYSLVLRVLRVLSTCFYLRGGIFRPHFFYSTLLASPRHLIPLIDQLIINVIACPENSKGTGNLLPPFIYCPLSTRHSSYPAWVMFKSSPTPILIKTSNLGNNNAVQGLLGSDQILPVPPIVNDMAEALPWLLEVNALQCFYQLLDSCL